MRNKAKMVYATLIAVTVFALIANLPLLGTFLQTKTALAQVGLQLLTTDADHDGKIERATLYMPGCLGLGGGLGDSCGYSNFGYLNCPSGDTCEIPLSWVPQRYGGDVYVWMWCGNPYTYDCQIIRVEDILEPLDNWHLRNLSPATSNLNGVTYGNGTFVAVGDSGTILTSLDGTAWTPRTSGTSAAIEWVTYAGGIFVAVGDSGTILTSLDGTAWTPRASGTSYLLLGVTYAQSTFVAVGDSGTILTSLDGTAWTPRTSGTSNILTGVTYASGTFVAVGWGPTILTSPDAQVWTATASGNSNDLSNVVYGKGTFVAVGAYGTILTSPNATAWTPRTSGTSQHLYGVNYFNNTFVAVGDGGTILTSPDGAAWTSRASGTSNLLWAVTYGTSTFVVVGNGGTILQSGIVNTSYVSTKDPLCSGHNPCWPNIQNGIASASAPIEVKITQETYNENIILAFDQVITLQGGWDTNFTSNSSYTTISGSITISNGTMIFEYIILE